MGVDLVKVYKGLMRLSDGEMVTAAMKLKDAYFLEGNL